LARARSVNDQVEGVVELFEGLGVAGGVIVVRAEQKVAVVGLGGLGHVAVTLAHAMGADVTVLSRSLKKRDDGLRPGMVLGYADVDHGSVGRDQRQIGVDVDGRTDEVRAFVLPGSCWGWSDDIESRGADCISC
jgi:Zn-dependent alcohol dehydrogenase